MPNEKIPETKREVHLSYLATQVLAIIVQSAISQTEAIAGETTVKMDHVDRLRASMLFEQSGYQDVDNWMKEVRDMENKLQILVGHINKSEGDERRAAFGEIDSARAAAKVTEDKGPIKHDRHVDLALIAWVQKQITKSEAVLSNDSIFVYGELCTAFDVPLPTDKKGE